MISWEHDRSFEGAKTLFDRNRVFHVSSLKQDLEKLDGIGGVNMAISRTTEEKEVITQPDVEDAWKRFGEFSVVAFTVDSTVLFWLKVAYGNLHPLWLNRLIHIHVYIYIVI